MGRWCIASVKLLDARVLRKAFMRILKKFDASVQIDVTRLPPCGHRRPNQFLNPK